MAHVRGTLDASLLRDPASSTRAPVSLVMCADKDDDIPRPDRLTPAGRRKGAHVSYRSPQQLHYFNCPFQLGRERAHEDPTRSEQPLSEFEQPTDASQVRVPIFEGDLIICATDGLFDNMDERTLLGLVTDMTDNELQHMATHLVAHAKALSLERDLDSPFARLAKENDILWSGGMPDDITVILARVVRKDDDVEEHRSD